MSTYLTLDGAVRTALCVKNDMKNGIARIQSITATSDSMHTRVVVLLENEQQFRRLQVLGPDGQAVSWGTETPVTEFKSSERPVPAAGMENEPNYRHVDGMLLPILVRAWEFNLTFADEDLR